MKEKEKKTMGDYENMLAQGGYWVSIVNGGVSRSKVMKWKKRRLQEGR